MKKLVLPLIALFMFSCSNDDSTTIYPVDQPTQTNPNVNQTHIISVVSDVDEFDRRIMINGMYQMPTNNYFISARNGDVINVKNDPDGDYHDMYLKYYEVTPNGIETTILAKQLHSRNIDLTYIVSIY